MNRIQKKCMIVSAGIHLLLAVMLIFGPGFFAGKPDNSPPVLTFIALKTTDDDSSGGGDNTVKAPPALGGDPAPPVTPTPVLTPAPVIAQPEPVPQPPERVQPKQPERDLPPVPKDPPRVNTTPRIDSTPVKPAPRKPHEINVDTTVVTSSAADARAKREALQKAAAAARAADAKRIAGINSLFKSATTGVRTGTAGSTEIRLSGPGVGGVPYGNFLSAVKKAYDDAWSPPNGVPETTVSVRITIARDGTILSAHITDASGNAALDGSVQKALDRVKVVPPLPDSETRDSRTVTIGFNPENK